MTKPWLGKVGALFIQKEDASFRHTLFLLSVCSVIAQTFKIGFGRCSEGGGKACGKNIKEYE